jgi:hypothetical protein
MPLFRNTWDNQSSREPEPLSPSPPPRKRSGFFGSRRSTDHSPTLPSDTYTRGTSRSSPTNSSGGFFSRRRSSDDDTSDRSLGRSGRQETSIVAARQKIADAENAERYAGEALKQARSAVREAREHIRILENEALEE